MIIFFVIAIILLILWGISSYNALVAARARIGQAASQIDVLLLRRADLIPNLLATVKGYAKHEQETFTKVVEMRNKLLNNSNHSMQEKMDMSNELSSQLKSVFALSEAYPELKANENFLSLQEELTNTENKIAYARKLYNDLVANYNITIAVFPSNIFAGMFNFQREDFLNIPEEKRAVPKVEF